MRDQELRYGRQIISSDPPTQPSVPSPHRHEPNSDPIPERDAVDYQDPTTWLAMLGPLCTNDGYVIVERSITPVLWPKLAEARTVMQAAQVMAQDMGIVVGGFSPIGGPWQIRAAQVTVDESALWPTMTSSAFTANIMLGQQEGEWRFVSFASSDQVNRLIQSKGDQSR